MPNLAQNDDLKFGGSFRLFVGFLVICFLCICLIFICLFFFIVFSVFLFPPLFFLSPLILIRTSSVSSALSFYFGCAGCGTEMGLSPAGYFLASSPSSLSMRSSSALSLSAATLALLAAATILAISA